MWFIRLLHLVFLMLLSVKNYAQVVYDGQPEDRPPMEAALRAINQRVYAIYGAYEHWGSGSTIFGATMEIPNLPGDGYLSYLSNESYCDVLTRALGIAEVQVAPGTYLWLDEDVIADQITYENGGPIFKYLAIESNDFQSMVTPQYAIARIKTLTAKMNCVPTGVNAKTGDSRSSYVDAFKLENNSSITLQDAVLLLADPDADPLTTVMDGQDGNYIVSRSIGHQLFWIESNATPIDVNQAAYVYGSAKHDYYNGTVSISVGYTKISQKYVVYAINNMRGSVRVYVRAIVPSWAMEAQECPIPTDGTYYLFDGGDVEKDKPFEGAKVFKPKVDGIPNFGLSYNKGNCAWYSAGAIGVMKFQYEDKGDSPPLPPPPEGCKFPAPAISGPPTPPLSIGPKDGFSPLGSVVELATGHYTHFAYDWSNVAPGLSCASCGGQSAGTVHGMPLLRIHKPGFFKFPSTLGNSTFYSFDVALLAYPGRDGWIVHDPAYHDFIYYNSHGVAALPEMPKIVFVDSDGNVVPKPITGGKAIVENMQGGKRTFETWTSTSVDPLAGFVPVGRMISEEDRSGNRWIYTYATEASSQTPYKRASCTDQYGRVFGFKYDAASGFDGGVAEVSLPGGLGIIQYRYSNRTLIEVRHPNGDVSTFSGWNPVSGGSIDDAAAEGVHRRKSVSLQSQGSLFSAQFDLLKALDVNVAPDILGTNCQLKGLLNGSGEVVMTRTEITTSAGFLVSSVLGSKNVRLTYDQRRFPVKSEVLNSG